MTSSLFTVPPVAGLGEKRSETDTFTKGAKVSVKRRAQAFDPFSREYFYLYPHTRATVMSALDTVDKRALQPGEVIIQLTSGDNGEGRIVQVDQNELELAVV